MGSKNKKEEIKEEVKETKTTTKPEEKTEKVEKKKVAKKEEKKVKNEEVKAEKVEVKVEKEDKKEEIIAKKKIKKLNKPTSDKVVIFIIVGICVLIALLVFGFVFYKSNYESVVSTKNGNVNKAEFTVYYKMFAPMLEYYGYSTSEIPNVIANKAGTDKLILKKAAEAGVTLSEENAKEIEEVFSDEEQINTWKQSGINTVILRKLYEEDYIISAYINKLAEDATDEEMLEYLKNTYGDTADLYEYNTSHILLKTTKTDDSGSSVAMSDAEKATVLAKAQALLARAQNGEDFATLAKENSEDTGTATEGGKFTFYDGDSVLEEYITASKTLTDGQIYGAVVETSAGYHIIKMDSKVENGKVNSENERSYYANELVNDLSSEDDIEIKTEVLNKVIKEITGVEVEAEEEHNHDEETDTTVDTTTDTTTETTEPAVENTDAAV